MSLLRVHDEVIVHGLEGGLMKVYDKVIAEGLNEVC